MVLLLMHFGILRLKKMFAAMFAIGTRCKHRLQLILSIANIEMSALKGHLQRKT